MMTDTDEALRALASLPIKDPRRRLRALMPTIDERVRAGVAHSDIIAQLATHGITISSSALAKRLYRWRRAQPIANAVVSADTPKRLPPRVPTQSVHSKADLIAMRSAEIDLEDLARLGKEHNQE